MRIGLDLEVPRTCCASVTTKRVLFTVMLVIHHRKTRTALLCS